MLGLTHKHKEVRAEEAAGAAAHLNVIACPSVCATGQVDKTNNDLIVIARARLATHLNSNAVGFTCGQPPSPVYLRLDYQLTSATFAAIRERQISTHSLSLSLPPSRSSFLELEITLITCPQNVVHIECCMSTCLLAPVCRTSAQEHLARLNGRVLIGAQVWTRIERKQTRTLALIISS